MKTVLKNTFPVCFLSETTLLIFNKGRFQILDINTGDISKLVDFKMSLKERILTKTPLFTRVLRKGVRCGIKVTDEIILFVIDQRIYELDIKNLLISEGFTTSDKSRPLAFSKIEGVEGFNDGIYFGGYKNNAQRNPISIYRRVQKDKWEEVYQFEPNKIEHIHHIIPDPYRNLVYIFTGDFDNTAGIWIAENDFKSVKPLLIGEQIFRGCVGFSTASGLVYATDSPFSRNSIRLLKNTDDKWESIHLMDINGPSIYGCQWDNDFVFSTSVEAGGRDEGIRYMLFCKKRGTGVIDNASHIYKGNLEDGFKDIYRVKKDGLPFFLFQFGVLIFPSELNVSPYLPVYHIATRKNGMNTVLLKNTLNKSAI